MLKQDLAQWRQRCLSYASDDAADEYPVGKAKLPSSLCHLPRTCQSCGTASPAAFSLFEKYSIGCQTFPCCCSKTTPTAVLDAFDLSHTGNLGSYTFLTGADLKASFSALKAACYSAPNFNDFLPCKISVKGAATLENP